MVVFLTSNGWKLSIAKRVFGSAGLDFEHEKVNVMEIQSKDPSEISIFSAIEGYNVIKRPVAKIDTGISIMELNGFPGPYSSYAEKTLGNQGIINLIKGLENREAQIYGFLTFFDGKTLKQFQGSTKGELIEIPRGEYGYFFDKIFIPNGEAKTLGEFPDDLRWKFWSEPYEKMARWLKDEGL